MRGPIALRTALMSSTSSATPKPIFSLTALKPSAHMALHLLDDVVERIAAAAPIGAGCVGVDGGARRPAEQHRRRHAEMAALEIPQRDVDAADGRDDDALLPVVAEVVVEIHPDHVGGARVAADQAALQGRDDGRVDARRPVAFAPAGGAVVGADLDDAARPHRGRGERPPERLRQRRFEHMRCDIGDLHGTSLQFSAPVLDPGITFASIEFRGGSRGLPSPLAGRGRGWG